MQRRNIISFSSAVSSLWNMEKNHDASLWSHRAQILEEAIKMILSI